MGEIVVADCPHTMALWIDHWQWWCGECGLTFPEYPLINFPKAHRAGDIYAP
jgi:hypothetical protein